MRTKALIAAFAGLSIGIGASCTYTAKQIDDLLILEHLKPVMLHKQRQLDQSEMHIHWKRIEPIPTQVSSETVIAESPIARKLILNSTGYTANQESTGKHRGDPAYGVTTSGAMAKRGITIAASKDIPMGTKVYIPFFDGKAGWNNQGIFTVQDRGGAIVPGHLDIFFGYDNQAYDDAIQFGRRHLDVYLLKGEIEIEHASIRYFASKS